MVETGDGIDTLKVESIVGFSVVREPVEAVLRNLTGRARTARQPFLVACANPNALAVAHGDDKVAEAFHATDVLVPDGIGVVLASRLLGGSIRRRITGWDVFMGVNRLLEERGGGRVFLLGATEATLVRMVARLATEFPRVVVAGMLSPPFKPEFDADDDAKMVKAVNTARADVLWVGMTAPKQEVWAHRNRARLEVGLIGAVGAVFDFYAGTKNRSPEWAQRTGLEWLPRLAAEPRRLWRRMFVSAPIFLWLVLRQRLQGST